MQDSTTSPADDETEELEVFGAAGPILVFVFVLWGVTMAAAASAVS